MSANNLEEERRKRFRRTAGEIDRHYRCTIESCQKSYGSEGSMNQHIKLKHPDLYVKLIALFLKNDNFSYALLLKRMR